MTVTAAHIEQALQAYIDPYLGCDPVKAGMIKHIDVSAGRVVLQVEAGFPTAGYGTAFCQALAAAVATIPGAPPAEIHLETKIVTHAVQKGVKPYAIVDGLPFRDRGGVAEVEQQPWRGGVAHGPILRGLAAVPPFTAQWRSRTGLIAD